MEKEFAKGLPSKTEYAPISQSGRTRLVIQKHIAERAGKHYDMRLHGPGGVAHSWVIKSLPGKKDRILAIQQPTHRTSYSSFEGVIPSGYGAGKVSKAYDKKITVISATNNRIKMRLPEGTFTMIKPKNFGSDKNWLMVKNAYDSLSGQVHKEIEDRVNLKSLPPETKNVKPDIIRQGVLREVKRGDDIVAYARIRAYKEPGKPEQYSLGVKHFPLKQESETRISKEMFNAFYPKNLDKPQEKKRYKLGGGWVVDKKCDGSVVAERERREGTEKSVVPKEWKDLVKRSSYKGDFMSYEQIKQAAFQDELEKIAKEKKDGKKQKHPVSESQRRWAYWAEEHGDLPEGKAKKWSRRVKGKDLPKHANFNLNQGVFMNQQQYDQIKQAAFQDELEKISKFEKIALSSKLLTEASLKAMNKAGTIKPLSKAIKKIDQSAALLAGSIPRGRKELIQKLKKLGVE